MTTTAAAPPPETTRTPGTTPATADRPRRRISARVRILLWLLLVMAVALGSVAATTRTILLRDVGHRVNGVLAQETGEFANFEERGLDPENGRPGLSLVPRALRDPGVTTTHGVGELIRAALDTGVRKILVGCGDSGTSDGVAGALQALGVRLLDADGRELPFGGREPTRLARVDARGLDPRLRDVELRVACNPYNVLCGERGVARVFGPQKGATPARVEQLSAGLENWAYVLTRDLAPAGADLRQGPGTGASGGLGAGLAALGARLLPRFEVLLGHLDLDARLARADLVITAEGALDHQTPRGKVPAELARRAKLSGRPVLALAGTLGEGAHQVPGVDACHGILPAPRELAEALVRGAELLTDATGRALRMTVLGARLPTQPALVR
ncbi:glycerate kinase [Streptomyces broussonetiae]|uniref:Glycerate kinase n=1 Tax=Streptomyces broussonetiae TaxID=2686304 RepID=A0ABV5EC06_9ACTN